MEAKRIGGNMNNLYKLKTSRTLERTYYAQTTFDKNKIDYSMRNKNLGYFICYDNTGRHYEFYAGTGKIQGYSNIRGIYALIQLIKGTKLA